MPRFIGYTIGLMATHPLVDRPRLVKAEYERADQGVWVRAVNGNDLSPTVGERLIPVEEFNERPQEHVGLGTGQYAHDNVSEARWALRQCGWEVAS